jgi:hypothetical protein
MFTNGTHLFHICCELSMLNTVKIMHSTSMKLEFMEILAGRPAGTTGGCG